MRATDNVLESVVDGNGNGVAACHGTGRWPAAEAATMVSTMRMMMDDDYVVAM